MNDLTAVVTGGASGVGRTVADAFADEGATVAVGARDGDAVAETVAALENRLDGTDAAAAGLRTDVRDEFDLERLVETASRTGDGSGIDVVVPAAESSHGQPGSTPIDGESYAAFDDHWRTNARGVFGTVLEALPHLNDGARVLVPTVSVARETEPGAGTYAVSKAAVEAVARGFAADTDYAVGCLDVGRRGVERSDGAGTTGESDRNREAVAKLFVRAATEADPAELDGTIVDADARNETNR